MSPAAQRIPALLVTACLLATTPAAAHAGFAPDAAEKHFAQGIALYEEGDFAGALFEFRRAYALAPDYRLLYNIGVAQLETRDYAGALRSLTTYLEQGGSEIAAARRDDVTAQLQVLRSRVGTVVIHSNVAGAEVRIDGELVGVTPLPAGIALNIGSREITLSAKGYEPSTQRVDVTGGEERVVEAELSAIVSAPPRPATPTDAAPPPRDRRTRGLAIASFVGLGTTAGVGIGAIVTGVLALRADDRLQRELDRFPADPDAVDDASGRRDTLSLTTDALIGCTAALAAVTLGLGIAAIVSKKRRGRGAGKRAQWHAGAVQLRF